MREKDFCHTCGIPCEFGDPEHTGHELNSELPVLASAQIDIFLEVKEEESES